MPVNKSSKEVVQTFLQALNSEDFEKAQACLSDDMIFDGVMGKRNGSSAYIGDMKKMKFKYEVERIFEEGSDVCVLYNIDMSGKATIFTCGWYQLEDGKISKLKVVFDPRPLLEKSSD